LCVLTTRSNVADKSISVSFARKKFAINPKNKEIQDEPSVPGPVLALVAGWLADI